jgi:hypothetical protein
MSTRQLRRRIEETKPLLAPYVRRGEKNKLLLELGAVKMLQAIEARRGQGATVRDAVEEIAVGIGGNQGGELGNGHGRGELPGESSAVRELVDQLRRENERLIRENERLWQLVNDRLPQLPAPIESRTPLQRLWSSIFGARS